VNYPKNTTPVCQASLDIKYIDPLTGDIDEFSHELFNEAKTATDSASFNLK
jgi:hypothetical protein